VSKLIINPLPCLPPRGKVLNIISPLGETGKGVSKFIILALFSIFSCNAYCQIDCSTNPPLPPLLKSVSVQPETGRTEFTWTSSPSPNIAAYVLYSYKNGDGMAIDTIWDPAAISYTLSSTATKYFSVSYVVAAMRLPRCTSIFSNVLNTIFVKADLDTCNKKIVVAWNSYSHIPVRVTGYSILQSVNGSSFTEAASAGSDINSFTLNDFATDADYCFVVKANLEGGTFSASNKSCLSTKMQRPPRWVNADFATINADNKVSLSFTIDPLSEIKNFRLERKSGLSDAFNEISKLSSVNGSVLYTDIKADVNVINSYRLSALNNCNNAVTVSNICSNIVLVLDRSGNDFKMSWNSYKKWMGNVSSYRLFVNTGNGFKEKQVIPPTDTLFTLAYQEIMYEVTGNEVCFYIIASETSNPNGINGLSTSSLVCSSSTEIITVPDVFTPDNDLINDLFRPVLSFTPRDYHLVIINRQGRTLFESGSYIESWDGTQSGNPQPQGVYLWFLKVTTPSGKSISKSGTITIIRSRQ
jgi:gliding motility-associated-like protein